MGQNGLFSQTAPRRQDDSLSQRRDPMAQISQHQRAKGEQFYFLVRDDYHRSRCVTQNAYVLKLGEAKMNDTEPAR